MKDMYALTQDEVRDLFDYDETSGWLIWKKPTSNRAASWSRAGNIDSKGYRRIGIKGHQYREHQIIWLWWYGEFPGHQIDHINFNRMDNRIKNLRVALRDDLDNNQHRKLNRNNTSGHMGVRWHKAAQKWAARITVERKEIHLGLHLAIEDAIEAYQSAKRKYHAFAVATNNHYELL